jgi:hypothetical protein
MKRRILTILAVLSLALVACKAPAGAPSTNAATASPTSADGATPTQTLRPGY